MQLHSDIMKTLKFHGDVKKIITNPETGEYIPYEFHDGDTIDLPDNIADELIRTDRFFEEVKEKTIRTEMVNLKKKKKGDRKNDKI